MMLMLKTKTFWAGLGLIVSGFGKAIFLNDYSDAVNDILTGLGFIFLRQAINDRS